MNGKMNIIDVDENNVAALGFFCKMSDKKNPGYARKQKWLKERFGEGLRIKMLDLRMGGRGFIEYIPGEYAWRAVDCKGYMFIHCIFVVGKSKGNGYGKRLVEECVEDARKAGMNGVAMVTSENNWLARKKFLEKMGFEQVDSAPPSFALMVKKFKNCPSPSFTGGWEEKASKHKKGLTIFRSGQCPYMDDAARIVEEYAKKTGLQCKTVELQSAEEVRRQSPSAYGAFGIVYNGKLLSYSYLLEKELKEKLKTD